MRTLFRFVFPLVVLLGINSKAFAYYECGYWGPMFEYICEWYPDPTADPAVASNPYYLRSGDLNADGKNDFFVTGADIYRRVQDFLLLSSGSGYQVVLNLTPTQLNSARSWFLNSSPVSREDINMDGYFDMVLGEAVNGNDVVVLTNSSDGRTPTAAVVVDDDVRRAASEIATAVLHPQDTFASYDWSATYYYTSWYWYDPCNYVDIYASCGFYIPIVYPYTVYGRDSYTSGARRFIDGNRSALQNGSLTSAFTAASQLPGEQVILAAGTASVGSRIGVWALRIAITGVAVADAPVVVTGAILGAAAYGGYQIVSAVLSDAAPSDIGPNPTAAQPPPDPFDPCQRQPGGEVTRTGIDDDAARYDLKKNLEARGCSKPHAWAEAHHIAPLRANPGGNVGNELRAILSRNGVNINESSNGAWLPKNPNVARNVGTRAMAHTRAHTEQVLNAVRDRLLTAEAQSGANGIRQELRTIGEQMARGTFQF